MSDLNISQSISIDRSKSFDPITFIGNGWSIVEQDERAVVLTEVDLTKIVLETTLEKKEKSVKGKDKLKRLKEKKVILLDAGVFKTLLKKQHLIPLKWKEKTNGNTTYIFFDGTVLQNSKGSRCVLYLYWRGGRWIWHYYWLESNLYANFSSAILSN